MGVRLEAVFVAGLSAVSLLLNLLIKVQVARPRPTGHLVHIIQTAIGYSFPSGHVMAYIAYWGLLFCFGVILFQGRHWWRTTLLVTSAAFVVLIGPSRQRTWCAADAKGTRTHEGKEGLEIISDEALVLNSRNLQERLLLVKRKSVYPGAHRIGSTGHVSTDD